MKEFEAVFDIMHQPSHQELISLAATACGLPASKVRECHIIRRSLDARKKPIYRYRVAAYSTDDESYKEYHFDYKNVSEAPEVIVIGGGPAGMFASLELLQKGMKPVLLERGKDVHSRKVDISAIVRL